MAKLNAEQTKSEKETENIKKNQERFRNKRIKCRTYKFRVFKA